MRILAVDDDPIILELLEHFIASFGDHDLMTIDSPCKALEMLASGEGGAFDCFMLDIQMPDLSGTQLAKEIRQLPDYLNTPILMLTAMTDKSYIDAAFKAGATDYVTKPFEVNELRGRINLLGAIVASHQNRNDALAVSKFADSQPLAFEDPIGLYEPVSVYDVENFIDYTAIENYVLQLSRGKLFGSTAFGVGIRQIEKLHKNLTPFEFHSLIADVAEVISDSMMDCGYLMSYAGGGIFVGIAESNWRPQTTDLMDRINLALSQAELVDNAGSLLDVRVSAGRPMRLVWKTGEAVLDALGQAYDGAEDACEMFEKSRNDFWFVGQKG